MVKGPKWCKNCYLHSIKNWCLSPLTEFSTSGKSQDNIVRTFLSLFILQIQESVSLWCHKGYRDLSSDNTLWAHHHFITNRSVLQGSSYFLFITQRCFFWCQGCLNPNLLSPSFTLWNPHHLLPCLRFLLLLHSLFGPLKFSWLHCAKSAVQKGLDRCFQTDKSSLCFSLALYRPAQFGLQGPVWWDFLPQGSPLRDTLEMF